jgi:uncharacterized membrane protein YidH (DUF202 family)
MAKWKPGPGWIREKDGQYSQHFLMDSDFRGARAVASAFMVAAGVVLIAGAASAYLTVGQLHDRGLGARETLAIIIGIAAVTILVASALAFFGYVLELLVTLHFDASYARSARAAEQMARP